MRGTISLQLGCGMQMASVMSITTSAVVAGSRVTGTGSGGSGMRGPSADSVIALNHTPTGAMGEEAVQPRLTADGPPPMIERGKRAATRLVEEEHAECASPVSRQGSRRRPLRHGVAGGHE